MDIHNNKGVDEITRLDNYSSSQDHDAWRYNRIREANKLDKNRVMIELENLYAVVDRWDGKNVYNLIEVYDRISLIKYTHQLVGIESGYPEVIDRLTHCRHRTLLAELLQSVCVLDELIVAADESGWLLLVSDYMGKPVLQVVNLEEFHKTIFSNKYMLGFL